jgi:hypothetical protein
MFSSHELSGKSTRNYNETQKNKMLMGWTYSRVERSLQRDALESLSK